MNLNNFHGITKWWEGTSGDHLVPPPAQSRVNQSRLLRAMSGQVFSNSKGGDAATSLGSLCQCLTTCKIENFTFFFLC